MQDKILIVDDEQEIADLVSLYLTNEGFQVFKFYNAADAWNCIQTENLDLAILDVMLPDMNGFELCQKIREKYQYPVIMLTAKGEGIDKITGLTLGADDYITKPFDPQTLRLRIDSHLANRRRTRAWALAQLTQLTQFAGAPGEAAPTLAAPGAAEEATPSPVTNVPPLSHVDAQYLARLESTVLSLLPQGGCGLEAVAERMGQSTRTLQRKLQALYGCGFSDYVAELQLRQAKALLREGTSAKRAALEAGYSSQSYMSRVFRKRLGCTPSEYQSRQPCTE